jgi:CHASE2 domain-containing sensor protein
MSGSKIAGVYVHSSIFTTLLNNSLDNHLSNLIALLFGLLIAVLVTILVYRLRSLPLQLLTIALLFLGVFLLADYFFEQLHSVIPAPHYLLAIALFAGYTILFRFLKERKQNDYIKNLFSKYVDKDVLRITGEGGEMEVLTLDKPTYEED